MNPPRWTKEQLDEYLKQPKTRAIIYKEKIDKGDRYRNKWEREFAGILNVMKKNGDILAWEYEPAKFRLAKDTGIIPDFIATNAEGNIIYEVKGFSRPSWVVKWKIFKEKFSWLFKHFYVCKKINGSWNIEE